MKKVFIGIVFLAASVAAFGKGGRAWAESDRVVYDGESEIIFDYSGPEGVLARVYRDGELVGDIGAGETERWIVEDGTHNVEVHSGVYDTAKQEKLTNPQSLSLSVEAWGNRSKVRITVSAKGGENIVTGLALEDSVSIYTRTKPGTGRNWPAGAALPDVVTYSALFLDANGRISPAYTTAASDDDKNRLRGFGGDVEFIDTPLEIALLSTCAVVINIRPPEAEKILPAGDPRAADLKLGALVVKSLAETRFLAPKNTAAISRYEGMLAFIAGRGNVTRAEIEAYYRQAIGQLVAETVDAEFNKIEFVLDKGDSISYNAMLTCNPATRAYTLSYERPSVENDDKQITAPSLNALLTELRSGANKADFDQDCIEKVRTQAALIPAADSHTATLTDMKQRISAFYLGPNQTTFNALKDFYTCLNLEFAVRDMIRVHNNSIGNAEVYERYGLLEVAASSRERAQTIRQRLTPVARARSMTSEQFIAFPWAKISSVFSDSLDTLNPAIMKRITQ
ncbi:MAG: hypothetical protein LBO04_00630 [Spirochaetaceae bacterium]|jgi:hypothetical protein|nr:hypothetical protein [Spirochaetaceae bacterium]